LSAVEFTPQQEIKRKEDGSAAVEAGQGPAACRTGRCCNSFKI
jgi:hypothetical protein